MTASGPETPTYLSPAGVHVPLVKKLARKVSPRLRTHAHWLIYDTPKVSEFFSARDAVMRIAHVSPETVLVLDGFPRSGNSYARAAFLYANGIHHKISTHGHSHRFPVRGAQEGIPVIVLIREPEAAIASMLQFEPTMDARLLANAYTRYYRGILPVIDSVVVAPFEEVTSDFGSVLARCNEKFGSAFTLYERTPEAERDVHAHIDAGTRNAVADERFDAVVPRPGFRTRDGLTGLDERSTRALDRARAAYREVLARSGA